MMGASSLLRRLSCLMVLLPAAPALANGDHLPPVVEDLVRGTVDALSRDGLTATIPPSASVPDYAWAVIVVRTGQTATSVDIGRCPAAVRGDVCFVNFHSALLDPEMPMSDRAYKLIADMNESMSFAKAVALKGTDGKFGYNIVYDYYAEKTDIRDHVVGIIHEFALDGQRAVELYHKFKATR
jgi:hypothetical protein